MGPYCKVWPIYVYMDIENVENVLKKKIIPKNLYVCKLYNVQGTYF